MLHLLLILGLGQIAVTPAPIHNPVTYTTAADVLYVDPTGSDTNACTQTGTQACLTIQGAFNKSPQHLYHQLTINVAAGTYAGATISGFTIDPAVQKVTAGILLDGALANVTPTTGTATGTASAGSAGSGSTFGTLTDGTKTWTVNDAALVGKFVIITGGTGNGQVRVVVSNTATVLTIAGTWTAPTGTSTYALQSPSVNITSAAAAIPAPLAGTGTVASGLQILNNSTDASMITIRNVNIAVGTSRAVTCGQTGSVSFVQTTFTQGTGAGIVATLSGSGKIYMTTSSYIGTGAGISTTSAAVSITTSMVSTSVSAIGLTRFSAADVSSTQLVGLNGVVATISSLANIATSRVDCLSAALSTALSSGQQTAATSNQSGSIITVGGNVGVTNCSVGLMASGLSVISIAPAAVFSGNALTYGVNAVYGGHIILPTATTTITGVTAEMSVDSGAAVGTFASLTASFKSLANLATGSGVTRL